MANKHQKEIFHHNFFSVSRYPTSWNNRISIETEPFPFHHIVFFFYSAVSNLFFYDFDFYEYCNSHLVFWLCFILFIFFFFSFRLLQQLMLFCRHCVFVFMYFLFLFLFFFFFFKSYGSCRWFLIILIFDFSN